MMFGYPNFRRFYPNYYRPFSNFNYASNVSTSYSIPEKTVENKDNTNTSNVSDNVRKFPTVYNGYKNGKSTQKKQNPSQDPDVFNILGLSLHFDDLLIIGLLFLLYTQDVDDPYLFMCLILLLLS